jgi:hypothetical protein
MKNESGVKNLSLCLFCDGTPLVKSRNLSLWIMLCSILELPQNVRESKQNIIVHSIIIGNSIDFNRWFYKCNDSFSNLLGEKTLLNGYRTRLFCSIFDLPTRAKALNMVNHNGYNACINCNITGTYEANKFIFPYTENLI